MRDLILHHYPATPFGEKVRLMLGFKGLAWRSVTIPVVMPKPDVVAPPVADILEAFPKLLAWHARVLAFGHGDRQDLSSTEALAVAAAATARAPVHVEPGLGFAAGDRVTVAATDYGSDPVTGTLVGLTNESVTVGRQDERAGLVHVHFPRLGFKTAPAT